MAWKEYWVFYCCNKTLLSWMLDSPWMHQQGEINEPVQTSNCMITPARLEVNLNLKKFSILWKLFGHLMKLCTVLKTPRNKGLTSRRVNNGSISSPLTASTFPLTLVSVLFSPTNTTRERSEEKQRHYPKRRVRNFKIRESVRNVRLFKAAYSL